MTVYRHGQIKPQTVDCDVCIIGSGAGGSTLAAGLTARGHSVVMLEAGPYHRQPEFDMDEGRALRDRYQESGTRSTDDLAISILQGACVGGGTTVNWTTCFRTPDRILSHWANHHGLSTFTPELLAPHFEAVEKRLNIHAWPAAMMNANNRVIAEGAKALGWEAKSLKRNVKACVNSGYCGMGCPANAKQGMLLTYLPDALKRGMILFADTRADRIVHQNGRVSEVLATVWSPTEKRPTETKIRVRPKVCVSACGAINGPALFLRSALNQSGKVGHRTMLHPVVGVASTFAHEIKGWSGAPQSAGSHQFIDRGADQVGFFIETAPTHPVLAAIASPSFGAEQQNFMTDLKHTAFIIAISVDGLIPTVPGGIISLKSDGRIGIDYPVSARLADAFKAAHFALAELSFAAGARGVRTLHTDGLLIKGKGDLSKLNALPYGPHKHSIFSAHQMGGLTMGVDPTDSVVNQRLQHHQVANLFVVDGSVFPTALGVNPSETIYAIAHRSVADISAAV